MSESAKLVDRVRKVADMGWEVDRTTDGFWIKNPRGETFTIHMTHSDGRSLINAVAELEGRGKLKDDEAEQRRQRMANRRAKLTAEARAAEERAERMAASQQGMISKAAGPYRTEIDECDLGWLTAPHPAPWMRWMYITPAVAQKLLDDYNDDNRPLRHADATRYAEIMLSRQWHLTHQGLAMDTRPKVQDAQHRLRGIVLAGNVDPDIKVPFAVFVGMPTENFKAIDEGRLRNAGQMLKMKGVIGGAHMVTVLRTVAAYNTDNPRGFHRGVKFSQAQAFEAFEADADNFTTAMTMGTRAYPKTRITPGIFATAYYLIHRANDGGNAYVDAFFQGIMQNRKANTNLVLPDDDPRAVLLSKFHNMRPPSPVDGVMWVITAWNNLVRGQHPRYMRVSEETPIPRVLKCVPGDGAAPRALAGEL